MGDSERVAMVTVKELQAQLKKRGLETKGLKAELIKRLDEAEKLEAAEKTNDSPKAEESSDEQIKGPDEQKGTVAVSKEVPVKDNTPKPDEQLVQKVQITPGTEEHPKPVASEKSKGATGAASVATMLDEELDYEDEEAEELPMPHKLPLPHKKRKAAESVAADENVPASKMPRESPASTPKANPWLREAKEPLSSVLLIKNFVRPFTVQQAKDLLSQNGTIKNFWMDSIRTHCFATFETEEQAQATREAIDGVQWPHKLGRRLHADFSTEALAAAALAGPTSPRMRVTSPRMGQNPTRPDSGGPKANSRQATENQEPAKPMRRLDDLFRKTSTKPAIYWVEAQTATAQ